MCAFHALSAKVPLGQNVKQYGHSKNLSPDWPLGAGGKATASLAGCHVDIAYSETEMTERASMVSNLAAFRLVAVVTDGAARTGGASSLMTGGVMSLDKCLPTDGREGVSSRGVIALWEEMEARA